MKTAIATISLKAEDGGKKVAIGRGGDYSCPVFFLEIPELELHGYDCRLLLKENNRSISPGETASNVRIAFLSPDEVFAHIKVGTRFVLWEMGPIGEGEITSLPA